MLKAEVIATLLYGCATWSPNKLQPQAATGSTLHASPICLGWRKRKRDDHTLSYADALAKTESENIQATVWKTEDFSCGNRGVRMGEERLPRRTIFG